MSRELTQDVFNGLQKSYRYAAVDASGRAYAYTYKPVLSGRYNIFCVPDDSPANADYLNLQGDYDTTNWQKSLIERETGISKSEEIKSLLKIFGWRVA